MTSARQTVRALSLYEQAESRVYSAGYGWEADWQRQRLHAGFTEEDLLREAAWVVLCSGFRESVVRNVFDYVSLCFCDWESAEAIARHKSLCIETALHQFKNRRKISAIAEIAEIICEAGFDRVHAELYDDPIEKLQALPFIGPTTSWHLAKNLGFNVAKNDRHLARLAVGNGFADAHTLCALIAQETGELAGVVDIILWRYAVLATNPS